MTDAMSHEVIFITIRDTHTGMSLEFSHSYELTCHDDIKTQEYRETRS